MHNNNPDFTPEVINNSNTNIQLGTVNIKKSITFTNKDNNKQQYRTKFNNINENNLVEIYTKSGMSNVELNGGNYKTQDITNKKALESDNMKTDINSNKNSSFKPVIIPRYGSSGNNNIQNITVNNNIQENDVTSNDNIIDDIEQENTNTEHNFNNDVIGENSKVVINNKNVTINNFKLNKNSTVIVSENNEKISVNNIDAYENAQIINENKSNNFTSKNIKAYGKNVVIEHSNDYSGGDTIILKDDINNNDKENSDNKITTEISINNQNLQSNLHDQNYGTMNSNDLEKNNNIKYYNVKNSNKDKYNSKRGKVIIDKSGTMNKLLEPKQKSQFNIINNANVQIYSNHNKNKINKNNINCNYEYKKSIQAEKVFESNILNTGINIDELDNNTTHNSHNISNAMKTHINISNSNDNINCNNTDINYNNVNNNNIEEHYISDSSEVYNHKNSVHYQRNNIVKTHNNIHETKTYMYESNTEFEGDNNENIQQIITQSPQKKYYKEQREKRYSYNTSKIENHTKYNDSNDSDNNNLRQRRIEYLNNMKHINGYYCDVNSNNFKPRKINSNVESNGHKNDQLQICHEISFTASSDNKNIEQTNIDLLQNDNSNIIYNINNQDAAESQNNSYQLSGKKPLKKTILRRGNNNIISIVNNQENDESPYNITSLKSDNNNILRAADNNNTQQNNYYATYKITCMIKYNENYEHNWTLESDHFNNNESDEPIYVKLNINGSDENYRNINVPYVKHDNFLTIDKGKQVNLVDNEPVETNNGTYRFIINKNNLYLVKVTDGNRELIEQAINNNNGYVDDTILEQVLSQIDTDHQSDNNNKSNDTKSNSGSNKGNSSGKSKNYDQSGSNKINGEDNEDNIDTSYNDEDTENDYILNNGNNKDLILLLSDNSGENGGNGNDPEKLLKKLMRDPSSVVSTYCANIKAIEHSNMDLMNQVFDDDFLYIFSPFNASKKKYLIRGSLYGLNDENWNNNNVFFGGDIFNDLILDHNSHLKLQLMGGTSFGNLTNNNNKYKTMSLTIGPKLSLQNKNLIFEILGLYKYSTVSYNGDEANKFCNNEFILGSKLGINLNISNAFVVQPYLKVLYSYIQSNKPIKNLSSKYQLSLVPGISLGLKLRNNVSLLAYYQHYSKSILWDKNGTDFNDNSINYMNEFGIGINKIFNNSIEIGTKLAVDIVNINKKGKKQNDSNIKLQAEISKLL